MIDSVTQSAGRTRTTIAAGTAVAALIVLLALSAGSAQASTLFAGSQTPGGISTLKVSASGQVSVVAGSPFLTSQEPRGLIGSPDGTKLFAGHRSVNTISRQSVGADGSLSTIGADAAFAPTATGYPAFSPDGRHLYFSSVMNNGSLQHYAVGLDGSLTPLGTAVVASNGASVTVTPDGRFMYVCSSTQGLHGYSLDAAGEPTVLSGFPLAGSSCAGSVITPDGRFLVTAQSSVGVRVFSIGSGGDLTLISGPTPTGGPGPNHVEVSPDGKNVYVLNIGSASLPATVAQFNLAADGTATHSGTDVVVTSPTVFANGLAISPDGRSLAVSANIVTSNLFVFATNAGGQLTPVAGSPFASGGNMSGLSPMAELAFRSNQGPSVSGISSGGKNRVRTFSAVGATDSDGTVASYVWNFGDGTSATTSTPDTSHTYLDAANYSASLSVIDDENCGSTDVFDGRKFLCNASGSASATATVDALPPAFSRLKFSKKSAPRGGKVKLRYKLSQAATVKVTFQLRKGKKYKSRGSLTFKSGSGSRSKTLTLKIKGKKLPKGSYRVLVVGTDSAQNTSSAKRLTLKVR